MEMGLGEALGHWEHGLRGEGRSLVYLFLYIIGHEMEGFAPP